MHLSRLLLLPLLCTLTALLIASSPAFAILTSVDPREVFTVTEVVPPGHIAIFSFQLNPEYLLAVSAQDRDSGEELHEWKDRPSGMLNIAPLARKRTLHFSFNNVDSMLTTVYINFDIRVIEDPNFSVDTAQLDPIEKKMQKLFNKVADVRALQQALRYQQKDHRATVEDVNERVLLWSVLQVVGFLVMSGGQLYLLTLFLEKKRTV